MQGLQSNVFIPFMAAIGLLSACAGESAPEKAFIGTWVQDTPYSTTDKGLQTARQMRRHANGRINYKHRPSKVLPPRRPLFLSIRSSLFFKILPREQLMFIAANDIKINS